jgi:ketosteroid isomerase-like protein
MTADPFDQFLATTRPDAASAFVTGDAAPVTSISTRLDPATFYGPSGGSVSGAAAVIETNEAGAAMFKPGGETRLEMLHSGHDGDLGYWVGFQHATVHMAGSDEPVPMKLRITELFRYEGDAWKLVHRHADPHADADQR